MSLRFSYIKKITNWERRRWNGVLWPKMLNLLLYLAPPRQVSLGIKSVSSILACTSPTMPFALKTFTSYKSQLSLLSKVLDALRNETRNQAWVVKEMNLQSLEHSRCRMAIICVEEIPLPRSNWISHSRKAISHHCVENWWYHGYYVSECTPTSPAR